MRVCQFRHFCICRFSRSARIILHDFPKMSSVFCFFIFFYFPWLCRSFTVSPVQSQVLFLSAFSLPCSGRSLPRKPAAVSQETGPGGLPSGKAKSLSPSGNRPFFIMQEEGLEPSWYCYHTDLNRARLPIPPLLHLPLFSLGTYYFTRFSQNVKCFLFFYFLLFSLALPLLYSQPRPEPGSFSFRFFPPLFRQIPAPKTRRRQSGNRTRRTSVRESKKPVSFRKQAFLYNAGGGT